MINGTPVNLGLIELDDVLKLIKSKPPELDIVLTGNYAKDELIEIADLVTEMKEIKHPFQKGQKAKKGIDYKEKESIEYMIEFGCDEYYMIFSYIRGWCVRVNRKKKDISNKALYKYVETIGSDLKYKELVDIHLQLIKKFGNYIIY